LALDEHASIAAFARVTLDLLALGAPVDLLARTQQAALDEVEHARDAFRLASSFEGAPVGPGPLAAASPTGPTDLVGFARDTFIDGCLNETLSTALAAARLDAATHPQVRAVLEKVVADESRHAGLAWATVAWALRVGGAPVRRELEAAWAAYRMPTVPDQGAACPGLGAPDADTLRRALDEARAFVLEPAVAQLLAGASGVVCAEA
jgi:hypothetical protein